jgi:5-methylcytosine-specific restriction endonuclease McrA
MPSSKNYKRNYGQEYENYQGKPAQIKKRSKRNAARKAYEKAHGDLPSTVDVDHKRPLAKGGGNSAKNLRAVSQSKNSSFRRTRRARMA